MAKHVWTIVCEKAFVDQFTGTLSLISQIEEVQVPTPPQRPDDKPSGVPTLPVGWYVVSYWRRTDPARPERTNARCKVVAPDGKVVAQLAQELNFEHHQSVRGLMQLPLLPLRGAGTYQFVLYTGTDKVWKKVTSIPVTVRYIEPSTAVATPAKPAALAKKRKVH